MLGTDSTKSESICLPNLEIGKLQMDLNIKVKVSLVILVMFEEVSTPTHPPLGVPHTSTLDTSLNYIKILHLARLF